MVEVWGFYLLLLCTSMLWAGNFVAGKFLVGHASPMMLTDMRWVVAIVCLIPIVWWKEKRIVPPRQAIWPLFFMGLTGVMLFNWFMFLALERTSADNVGLLSALNPVAIAIVSFFLLRERMTGRQLIGMTVSFLGVVVVISHGDVGRLLRLHLNTGDLYMLCAVASWGFYSVAGRKAMKYVSPYMSTLWAGIFGVLSLMPFTVSSMEIVAPDPAFWLATVYVSVGATVLAMLFWNIGVQRVGGTKSGVFLNFNPIFTALLSFWLLGERMNVVQFAGTALVISGVYLFTALPRRANRIGSLEAKV
ncbi:DMT family transporter [Aneurinibacillus sp. UBA3580]|jgi:drug/metabolite transporter (DMT)-like permease|uniref:DMT family transporter n=1 Tax=Aneurinibacillus sp. UBA3580 TaxID=1946041 RepID=UPI00257B27B6|nr:DMT family transporter [Aneurinibacillus sp. UBA3580]